MHNQHEGRHTPDAGSLADRAMATLLLGNTISSLFADHSTLPWHLPDIPTI
jgi:hypothetical protein